MKLTHSKGGIIDHEAGEICLVASIWVCEYRNMLCNIDLRCAPPTCIVHYGAQGVAPDIFHFSMGHKEHAKMDTFCPQIDSIFVVDNEHASQGLQCSSVLTCTLVVHKKFLF